MLMLHNCKKKAYMENFHVTNFGFHLLQQRECNPRCLIVSLKSPATFFYSNIDLN